MGVYYISAKPKPIIEDPNTNNNDLDTSSSTTEINNDSISDIMEDFQFELDNRDLADEIEDRSDYSYSIEECDIRSDDYFKGCELGLIAIRRLEEADESGNYKELLAGMESYYRFDVYCKEYLQMETNGPGLESIVNTPLMSIEPGIENIRSVIDGLFKAIGGIIKWVMEHIEVWVRKIGRLLSSFGSKAKKLKASLDNFIKTHPNTKILSDRNSASFVEFLVKRYPGINRLTSPHVSKTPGVSGLGTTMVNLLDKEINLMYPSLDTMPLGKTTEFYRGLTGFYRGKDILNCKKAIKDSPEFGKMIAATKNVMADNDMTICKVFSVDYEYAWYILITGSDIGTFKPDINKVKLSKVGLNVPDIKPEDANKMFNNKPVEWLANTLDYIIKEHKAIMKKPEKMVGELQRTRSDLNKAYKKYNLNKSNKDVTACLEMYMKFTKKLVTKYQEGAVKSAISSMKQLMDVCSRLTSEIIGSSSIEEANKWDDRGQKTAKAVKDADLEGRERKPGFIDNLTKSEKQANRDLRYGNGDENDYGIKKSNKGLFGKVFDKGNYN